jgi:phospholipid/cholesterol/gamma-HCH transport system permease protein
VLRNRCTLVRADILNRFYRRVYFHQAVAPVIREFWRYLVVTIFGIYSGTKGTCPLVTALIAAGKVGSSIGAELGSMRVTEQIDAMEVSGTKPFKYLVCTRVLATTLTIPLLATYTALIALVGGYLNVNSNEGTTYRAFIESAFEPITFIDISASLAKAIVFGFTIGIVGCYQGYNSSKGTEGVGKAANNAVVIAMFLIFIEEVLIVQIAGWFR